MEGQCGFKAGDQILRDYAADHSLVVVGERVLENPVFSMNWTRFA